MEPNMNTVNNPLANGVTYVSPAAKIPGLVGDIEFPPQQQFDTPEMLGSIQNILAATIGTYVVVEFLIGTGQLMRKQGYLFQVGTSFITLYDDVAHNFITCDIFSVKFVYFYHTGEKPKRNYNQLPQSNTNMR